MAGQGRWELKPALSTPARNLRLVRVWLAPAWVTMRFSASAGPDSKDTMLQVTIWKSSVAPEAWLQLRVRLAGRVARPEPMAARAGERATAQCTPTCVPRVTGA